ncbi:MAG: LacI family DNA-binding transcriptional regulator [Pseudomonadota bacterium]
MAREPLTPQGGAKIEDVARAAGVSIMTVSRALRGVEGVSAQKRELIVTLAREMRYSPSSLAGSLAAAHSNLIGVSVPTLDDAVFSEIFETMRMFFLRRGFQTVFDTTDYATAREEDWVERMIAWRPAGIVLSGVDHSPRTKRMLLRSGIPTLEIWSYSDNPIDMCVGIDHFAAGLEMGRFLVDLGYRRPAHIGPRAEYDVRAEQRLDGLKAAFGEYECAVEPCIRMDLPLSFEGGRLGMKRLLDASWHSEKMCPDVVCFLNDHMAFGGLIECEARGIDVPQSLGIVGFNGLRLNSVLNRPITTTTTPRAQLGEKAAQLLIAKMSKAATTKTVKLPVTITPGQTTRTITRG